MKNSEARNVNPRMTDFKREAKEQGMKLFDSCTTSMKQTTGVLADKAVRLLIESIVDKITSNWST